MPGIVIQIQGDGSGAAEALRVIEERMKETAATAGETSDAFERLDERIEKGLEYTGIYMGIRESVDAVRELIGGSVDLGMEMGHLSRQTGISAENLSVLKVASDDTGISFDSLVKGFKKLSTSLLEYQEGSRMTVDAFKLLNISQADLAATGGDVYKVMGLVADRMAVMPDGWKKSAAAVQLFGRAGQELIPILDQGREGVEQFRSEAESMGVILTQDGIEKMEELHRSSAEAKGAMEGLGLTITSVLAPFLQDLSTGASSAVEEIEKLLHLKDKVSTEGLLNGIPDEVVGASDPEGMATKAYTARDAANAQLDHFTGLYNRKLISQKEYNSKRAALQREAASEQLRASQAEIVATEDQMTDAQAKLARDNSNTSLLSKIYGTDSEVQADKGNIDSLNRALQYLASNAQDAKQKLADIDKQNDIAPPASGRGHKGRAGQDIDAQIAEETRRVDEQARREQRQMEQLADAKERLKQAMDRASEEQATSHGENLLAILEAQHAAGLESDKQFYADKLKLKEQMFDAEKTALEHEQHDLQTAVNASPADSQKRYALQARLVSINARLAELADRRKTAEAEITAELQKQEKAHKDQMDPAVAARIKDQKNQQAAMAKESAQTVTQMLSQIQSAGGRDPLRQVTTEMTQDIERLALKLMEERWIIPMMQSLFGIGGGASLQTTSPTLSEGIDSIPTQSLPGFAGGGDPTGPSIVGEKGPELFVPKGPGTVLPNDMLSRISSASGGAHGPNVTVNVSNNSSQPVTMRQTGMSYDAQAKHFVLHTVLEDLSQGGPMSQAMRGFGGG